MTLASSLDASRINLPHDPRTPDWGELESRITSKHSREAITAGNITGARESLMDERE